MSTLEVFHCICPSASLHSLLLKASNLLTPLPTEMASEVEVKGGVAAEYESHPQVGWATVSKVFRVYHWNKNRHIQYLHM